VLSVADIEATLLTHMTGRHKDLLPKNIEALHRGAECAQKEIDRIKS
jgi:hypothetical protein